MIGIIFRCGDELVKVTFDATNLYFSTITNGVEYRAPVTNIRFRKSRVITAYPELANDDEWNTKAGERILNLFKGMKTDRERETYLVEELGKTGYTPLYRQVSGHRIQKYAHARNA